MGNYYGAVAIGTRHGRLTVISEIDDRGYVQCLCSCGREKRVSRNNLGRSVNSCGCLNSETTAARNYVHGMSNTKTWKCWANMKARCSNPNETGYENYGGRGITVCDRWLESFKNFLEDMGEKPKGLSIEREDNNGNYEPGNCSWGTPQRQSRNRRSNRIIEHDGLSGTLTDWAEHIGVSVAVLSHRLGKLKKTMAEAIEMGSARYGRVGKKAKI